MSKIDRLSIMGIRSFPHQAGMTISFQTPLTLIVGVNGSGKTTIVECLKYATTGIQPPNTKGGAFIHDPKLTGEREMMAQVKLQFRDTKGARMVITRSLQLTLKKNTRTMKTLEGSLLIEKNGEKTTVSTRVAELDAVMPAYMGVAAAVLDNVIFCHQEESMWPLSEPSALKKKFDEIFEAQKYTKAIDNIKVIRKKQNEELVKYKLLETHAKEDRDRAMKARKKSEKLSDEIEELREKCNELQNLIDEAQARADKLWRDSESYARIIGTLEGKKIEAKSKQSIINDIRDRLKEVPESDEWLERTLEQFNATMSEYRDECDTKRESWLEWKDELDDLTKKKDSKLAEKGKHEQDEEEHGRQLDRRKTMAREASAKHQLRGYDDLEDDNQVEEFLYKIKKLAKEQSTALEKARTRADQEKQEALSLINRLTERKAALQESKVSAKQQRAQYDREASDYQRRVDQIKVDEGSKAVIESRIGDIEVRLQSNRGNTQTAAWGIKLKEANAKLRSQEDESSRLNGELVQSTKRAGEVARLAHLKQELKERKRSLETLTSAHGDRISQLIGPEWTAGTVDRLHQAAVDEALHEITSAERNRDRVSREIEQLSFKQKTIRDDIDQKTQEANRLKDAVCKTIGNDISEYDSALREAQNMVDEARDQAKGYDGLVDYFQKCLTTIEGDRPMCRTCNRGFKPGDAGLAGMKKRLEGLIKKADKTSTEADLPAAEAEYKLVVDAGNQLSNWKKLAEQDIPALERECKSYNSQREALITKLESHDNIVLQRQAARKDLDTVSRTVSTMAKCEADIKAFGDQIEELSTRQSQQGSTKTLEDIQEEITAFNESVRNTKSLITQLTMDENASKTQLHELELELRDLKSELNSTISQLDKKSSLSARVEEFRRLDEKQRHATDKADRDIEKLEPQVSTARAKIDDLTMRWNAELGELTRNAGQLSDTVNSLNLLNEQIKSYVERGGPGRLSAVTHEIKSIDQSITEATKTQTQLTKEISKIEDRLRDSEKTKQQYSDNLRYRYESRALDQLNEEIRDLSSRNAEVDRDRFLAESRHATREYQKHTGVREGHIGEMKSKDLQLQELVNDFETDFKDAPARYQEARIKVTTTKAAVADLQVYGSALDNAIMKFHSIKMEQVNEIIHDLWVKTYKGSDVDKIMIRSDHESTTASTTIRGRSYNYRVVMVKGGIEMDMRGRCSAGQKVLASIIIRLALADVFSQDCGLIALDEPTTNLDHANIVSLAESLHGIINERRRQANFQLIVITHDEEFLRAMHCADFADYYYRISRDRNANSMIQRQNIDEVER